MTRGLAEIRDATPDDARALQSIWFDFTSESQRAPVETSTLSQIRSAILRLQADPSERLLVAVLDEEAVGVAHLRRAPISPIHEQDAIHIGYLHVLSGHRRRGVGKQLLEAAADWAEAGDSRHVVASAAATARDAHRFLARLGLSQVAVVRGSTVTALRAKLSASSSRSSTTNVLAARRMRRRVRAGAVMTYDSGRRGAIS